MHQDEKDMIEYQGVLENMRHYSNMRFAYLTLFFAATAAFGSVLFTGQSAPPSWLVWTICINGALVTMAFIVCEYRTAQYWWIYTNRACELEKKHDLHTQEKFSSWNSHINSTNAVNCIYLAMFAAWFIVLRNMS
jgi:hypothetical protein